MQNPNVLTSLHCQYSSIGNTDEALVSSLQKQVYFYIKLVAEEYKI